MVEQERPTPGHPWRQLGCGELRCCRPCNTTVIWPAEDWPGASQKCCQQGSNGAHHHGGFGLEMCAGRRPCPAGGGVGPRRRDRPDRGRARPGFESVASLVRRLVLSAPLGLTASRGPRPRLSRTACKVSQRECAQPDRLGSALQCRTAHSGCHRRRRCRQPPTRSGGSSRLRSASSLLCCFACSQSQPPVDQVPVPVNPVSRSVHHAFTALSAGGPRHVHP